MRDVFLSYNHRNKPAMRRVYELLRDRSIDAWFDEKEIKGGDNFLEKMDQALAECRNCAVFVGPDGLGNHQKQELWSALSRRFRSEGDDEFRVVPVLLPGAREAQLDELPGYLNYYSHVIFDRSVEENEVLDRLVCSIQRTDLIELAFCFSKQSEDSYEVQLKLNGEPKASANLGLDLSESSRTVDSLSRIQKGTVDSDLLADVGVQLWGGITPGGARDIAKDFYGAHTHHVRLLLPPELEWLPWETLYDEYRREYLASDERYCIIRDTSDDRRIIPDVSTHAGDKIELLIVGVNGGGVNYARESKQIADSLETRLEGLVSVDSLPGPVTLEKIDDQLARHDYDVVHFIGHGRLSEQGTPELGFEREDSNSGQWVDVETFASLFLNRKTRLVVLNCCFSGAMPAYARRNGFGAALLSRGVPAVITMQFEIKDEIAFGFAKLFYEHLVSNPLAGRVDFALQQTRRKLRYRYNNEEPRAFVTPQLFLAKGYERLLRIQKPFEPISPASFGIHTGTAQMPDDLHSAIAERLCVPIVGPGLLTAGTVRFVNSENGSTVPGPRELALELVERLNRAHTTADRVGESELRDRVGEWLDTVILQRICQFYVDRLNRAKVVQQVADIYRAVEKPTSSMSMMAEWPTAAIVCSYFDGLMEKAFFGKQRVPTVVTAIDREVTPEPDTTLLVQLRGSWEAPADLVLTEREEHDLVWNRFANASSQIGSLLTGEVGRSPLFIGCDPRELLVRRLSDQLMPSGTKNLGDIFFLTASTVSPVDRAYWNEFPARVHWLECGLEAAIEEITEKNRKRR